jgi:fructosamine-3-kinase
LVADWNRSWTSFYGKLLAGVYERDVRANGFWKELDDAMKITLEKVIPRLLGVLEEEGWSVKSCLIQGDLWEENIGTDPRAGEIYIFDSCAYYAHHEMSMGIWRVNHHHMKTKKYRNEYFKEFEPDVPVKEYMTGIAYTPSRRGSRTLPMYRELKLGNKLLRVVVLDSKFVKDEDEVADEV